LCELLSKSAVAGERAVALTSPQPQIPHGTVGRQTKQDRRLAALGDKDLVPLGYPQWTLHYRPGAL
jgi:hypothetical protein